MSFLIGRRSITVALAVAALFCCLTNAVLADGTETLGQIDVTGTDIVGDGVGLIEGPATATIDIPAGVTVEKVLLYWNGFHTAAAGGVDQITIRNLAGGSAQDITGSLIGGPTLFFGTTNSSTYRADVTAQAGINGPGTYNIEISPLDGVGFDLANNGASILVVVNDPTVQTSVFIADGQDLAYRRFGGDLTGTQPQTFSFASVGFERFLRLTMMAGSVAGNESTGGPIRPNRIDVTIDGVTSIIRNPFNSVTGDEWDHVCNTNGVCQDVVSPLLDITIPANASSITVEAVSAGFCSGDLNNPCLVDAECDGRQACLIAAPNEPKPASFVWMATAMSIVVPFCGDGTVDSGEQCDDGNGDDNDACRNDCTLPFCGDEILDSGETCDPPGGAAGASGNICRGDCTVCGDGVVDPIEACDDGNANDEDACRNDCTVRRCGDGFVDSGETCDPPGGAAGASGNTCRDDCTVCGDGVADPSEQCDDGNNVDDDNCRNDCSTPACGDGVVDGQNGETCEPPGESAGANGNDCRADCTVCGDGIPHPDEVCDDANGVDEDDCRNNCTIPRCGDGIVDEFNGETCERPGDIVGPANQACRDTCTYCGDGVLDPNEECDDGNGRDTDECRNDCMLPVCGDGLISFGIGESCDPPGEPSGGNGNDCRDDCKVCGDGFVDPGEECDDANGIDSDSCRNDCTRPRCGDSVVDETMGETCDPPGQPAGANDNLCDDDCTVCGDGVTDGDEACDDGNSIDDDDCRNDCTIPRCGDGILDPTDGETCDPPGQPAGANDNLCDDDCTVCGDGVTDGDEACDDGNSIDDDDCRNDCTIPRCGDGIVDEFNGETCERPGDIVGPANQACRDTCTYCGDGVLDPNEECDDGNGRDTDECRNDCMLPVCGDGLISFGIGESCDPPGEPSGGNGNDCRDDCKVCGDGFVDPGEECDDANGIDSDSCRNDCTRPRCGDSVVDETMGETCDPPGQPAGANDNLCDDDCTVCGDGVTDGDEACDDGNSIDDDDCRNDCTIPRCGDGILDPTDGETCDPPGQPAGANDNLCDDDCTVCGDGVTDGDEACDDGNSIDDDDCRNNCTIPRCGDGILDPTDGETCDPPGQPAGPSGNDCRADCTVCGDGNVDAGEECDDGNGTNYDDCNNDCIVPRCDVQLDKQISCDGGQSYVDMGFNDNAASTCIGWDGDDEIKVRYVVQTDANGSLVNCELTDSNGMVLGGPIDIGTLPGDLDEFVIWETSAIECSEGLEIPEPSTATLTCECFEPGSGVGVDSSDQANIECQVPALDVISDCGNQDPATEESPLSITVSNPANPRGASLANCEVIDELANFVSDPFSLAPGESMTFDLTVAGLPSWTLNVAWVHCDIVGAGGKRVVADDHDICRVCPDITLDKQVSCDGGATFVDVGDDNGAVETCMGRETGDREIVVRYVANGMVNGYHGPCELVDSNGVILPNPRPMFGFPGAVFETSPQDCTAELEAGEPNTATLTCDCYSPDSGFTVSATDVANIECASPECGDGQLDDGESCDPPGEPAGASGNDCRDDCSVCGDGELDSLETCDDGNDNNRDGCRNDCSFCGDGELDSREECDDGNNDAGDGCNPECSIEEQCDIEVVKTCIVPDIADGDDDDDDCLGKVVSMKLQYTGEGCDATNNEQEGRAGCWGGASASEPVSVKVSDERGNRVYADVDSVYLGDIVEAAAANAGQNEFTSQTSAWIDHGLEDITFHTSCSKPLAVGDQFGSMLVVEMTTTGGGTVTLPPVMDDPNPDAETSECTIPGMTPGPHCDGKVQVLGFRYLGGDCSDSNNEQGDRFSCNGEAGETDPVRIICNKDDEIYLDTGQANVSLGDTVEVVAANGGRTELPSEISCWIRNESEWNIQDMKLHTSCSRPLNLGDRFGALEVYSLDTSNGGTVSMGTEVLYRYRITNHSNVVAENVTAVDSELGELPGSPVASIDPDETVLLEATGLIVQTTTNTVTVNATLETGEVCDAVEDTATVTVEDPPELQECTSKIDAMLLQYIGPDIAGPVTVEFLPRSQSDPVVYEFTEGLVGGTIVSSDAQNGFSVDPGVQGQDDAGSKTSIFINGVEEEHHTSCSTPYVSGLPAPLDEPKGDPSPNWFVISFTQK